MIAEFIATMAAGLFAGGAILASAMTAYRLNVPAPDATHGWKEMIRGATVVQGTLALTGAAAGAVAAWQARSPSLAVAAGLLLLVVFYTVLVMRPVNNALAIGPTDQDETRSLLVAWRRRHAILIASGLVAFALFLRGISA